MGADPLREFRHAFLDSLCQFVAVGDRAVGHLVCRSRLPEQGVVFGMSLQPADGPNEGAWRNSGKVGAKLPSFLWADSGQTALRRASFKPDLQLAPRRIPRR